MTAINRLHAASLRGISRRDVLRLTMQSAYFFRDACCYNGDRYEWEPEKQVFPLKEGEKWKICTDDGNDGRH